MSDPPCKDCQRKGCGAYHSQCQAYKEWAQQNGKRLDAQKKAVERTEFFIALRRRLHKK